MAAIVVPPGLLTPSTSCSGCCPVPSRSAAVPLTVRTASSSATSRANPGAGALNLHDNALVIHNGDRAAIGAAVAAAVARARELEG